MAALMSQSYCIKLGKYVNLMTNRNVHTALTMNLWSKFPLTKRSLASLSHCSSWFVKNRLCLTNAAVTPRCISSYTVSSGDEPDVLYKSIEIEVKGHDPAVINSYEKFVSMTAHELGVTVADISTPPRIINRYTLLKSVHIYRKHMVQYEMRTLFRNIQLKHLTGSTADTLLEYIQRNLPEGMAMKVTRHAIEAIPDHIKPPKKLLIEQRT